MNDPELLSNPLPKLLILDELDECDSDTPIVQQHILEILGKPTGNSDNLHLRGARDHGLHIGLPNNEDAAVDIASYVIDELDKIKRTHHMRAYLPVAWPSDEEVNMIVQRSSVQFIFEATLVRYIKAYNHKPHE
ncbi:hypothetical protein CPB83DRAFT_890341 [Crepidotus variabilis]|uniref:Uncharacterized protein n=1 Tax=Crepidotus variabilis TaxID=179855 RepID=A0A9P6ER97_9AGAR|nr:hypothetical protein CPB83DRAFT_890341 [Crepidotus variabilis]